LSSYINENTIKKDDVYKAVIACFMGESFNIKDGENSEKVFESDFEKDDSIKNMALLQGNINAKLNNKLYSEKRKIIAEYEQGEGEKGNLFVPICTRNVFFKHYSKSSTNPLMWDNNDGIEYLNAIITVIAKYLDLETVENEQKEKIGLKYKEIQ
jgi:hypothetical protein